MAAVSVVPQAAPVAQKMGIHGTSARMKTMNFQPLGELEFYDFAPAPCSCCACCQPDLVRKRMYARIFDNRLEANMPIAPFGCCTCKEECIIDRPMIIFMDRPPHRAGMCCCCIPCTCCGPPVIFESKPVCCCGLIDLEPCYGGTIKAAPSNYFNLKKGLCCCAPCYTSCAYPLFSGTKNADHFLLKWRQALEDYVERAELKGEISLGQMATCATVKDGDLNSSVRQVKVVPEATKVET